MTRKILTLLLFSIVIASYAQKRGTPTGLNNLPATYYFVRIQQWLSPEKQEADSVSGITYNMYPGWLEPLFTKIKQGKTKVYTHPNTSKPLSLKELDNILFRTDSLMVTNPTTYENELMVVTRETTYDDIDLIKFCEQWSWDENGHITKKVLAYAPVIERDDGETFRRPLFWIKQSE